jgi:hypothetical protein
MSVEKMQTVDEKMNQIGYISSEDAADLLSITKNSGGRSQQVATFGFQTIKVPLSGEHGRHRSYVLKSEVLSFVEKQKQTSIVFPISQDKSNGGKLFARIIEIEKRLSVLEEFAKQFE